MAFSAGHAHSPLYSSSPDTLGGYDTTYGPGIHRLQVPRDSAQRRPRSPLDGATVMAVNSASGTSAVAIDNKIEQAMDLVKSHLMIAVREEVEVLKERISELMDKISNLELENNILKSNMSPETLQQLQMQLQIAGSQQPAAVAAPPATPAIQAAPPAATAAVAVTAVTPASAAATSPAASTAPSTIIANGSGTENGSSSNSNSGSGIDAAITTVVEAAQPATNGGSGVAAISTNGPMS
ncbi:PREDICTED: protein bunched, class 1/class 3/D/E isoforms isoform X2 [Drosophila arizonae]|uniref:Protein bunched, class 1/class 3/D/E isoforms isoform X2 n=1 Tax=Drosophila arizonae TaxID=7263 RepID=A0ABM1NT25_DROAR|nr:PREDICTED: protein bunched, class 1/class 3/D/E isoforms isoform X2 [Drosophila arizonae]